MARPSKLTDTVTERVASLIMGGSYANRAAEAAGIGERTFYRWMKEGEAIADKVEAFEDKVDAWNDLSYAERRDARERKPLDSEVPSEAEVAKWQFWQTIKKAEAEAEARNTALIQTQASKSWQAAAWWLERKFPDRWGRKDKVQLDGRMETIETKKVSDTQAELADLLGEDA